jgi:hypothetical protein
LCCLGFLRGRAGPATSTLVRFIDEHKGVFGVEPICRVLYALAAQLTLAPPPGQTFQVSIPGFYSSSQTLTSATVDYAEQFATLYRAGPGERADSRRRLRHHRARVGDRLRISPDPAAVRCGGVLLPRTLASLRLAGLRVFGTSHWASGRCPARCRRHERTKIS